LFIAFAGRFIMKPGFSGDEKPVMKGKGVFAALTLQ